MLDDQLVFSRSVIVVNPARTLAAGIRHDWIYFPPKIEPPLAAAVCFQEIKITRAGLGERPIVRSCDSTRHDTHGMIPLSVHLLPHCRKTMPATSCRCI